jgi:hypothetical protein
MRAIFTEFTLSEVNMLSVNSVKHSHGPFLSRIVDGLEVVKANYCSLCGYEETRLVEALPLRSS